ncbi:MAG: HNH endonuclease [Myxococcota bacterium]
MARTHKMLLWAAATDRTFKRTHTRGSATLTGKCIHCNRKMTLDLDGTPLSKATLEHIVPRTHGGTHGLHNLAVACSSCNGQKGRRHDHKRWNDPRLQHVIQTLQERRRDRWRPPPPWLQLPPLPSDCAPDPEEAWPLVVSPSPQ